MARITVEDCIKKVGDRFELVALAAQLARDINSGAQPAGYDKHKCTVASLRLIAGHVDPDRLRDLLISRLQTKSKIDHINDDAQNADLGESLDDLDYIPDLYVGEDHSDLSEESEFGADLDGNEDY